MCDCAHQVLIFTQGYQSEYPGVINVDWNKFKVNYL